MFHLLDGKQITEIASDALECSRIAKRVAADITEGLSGGDTLTRVSVSSDGGSLVVCVLLKKHTDLMYTIHDY